MSANADAVDRRAIGGADGAAPGPLHASCVCLGPQDGPATARRALLILGGSGTGKSTLAMEMIALGACLVADDRVVLSRRGEALLAAPPPALAGLIEARGIGLLRLPWRAAGVAVALDLDAPPEGRLPPRRVRLLLDAPVPLMVRPQEVNAAALLLVLRHGPPLDPDAPLAP